MIDKNVLQDISQQYGKSFYLLNSQQFRQNYMELKQAFSTLYPNFNIAYSYKTNYIPKICKIVNELGGYAEVVSDMEYKLARKVGVDFKRIIYNGPYKSKSVIIDLLLHDGIVNIDNKTDFDIVKDFVMQHPDTICNIGIRCNFDINDGIISRFGYDVTSNEFLDVVNFIRSSNNLHLFSLQCHFATRCLDMWQTRVSKMLTLIDKYFPELPEIIDLGGGLFGKMPDFLKQQFDAYIPSYQEYAQVVALQFSKHFAKAKRKPLLLIEPGSALVGDIMCFVAEVTGIKNIRGKCIATVLGSIYNINPTLNKKNPPILAIVHNNTQAFDYVDLDFGGFTCIESDYLYRGYNGPLAVGDQVVFGNVGSYSIVLKPPFILPNFPILEFDEKEMSLEEIKRQEYFEDIYSTYRI